MDIRIQEIRSAEKQSHTQLYSSFELYQEGSWLEMPVRTVTDLFPYFSKYTELRVLDLGSGVGRNSIAIAKAFLHISCIVDCVDILPIAIEKLHTNAETYGVRSCIRGIVSAIEKFPIATEGYDWILSVSSLEHTDTQDSFAYKMKEIKNGLRTGGIVCLIVNSNVTETDKATKEPIEAQFEVNLSRDAMLNLLRNTFAGFNILKETTVKQQYDIPRGERISSLTTDVMTFVARKNQS